MTYIASIIMNPDYREIIKSKILIHRMGIILLMQFVFIASTVFSNEDNHYLLEIKDKKNGQFRSKINYSINHDPMNSQMVSLKFEGAGKYDGLENVRWKMSSLLRKESNDVKVLESHTIIFNEFQKEIKRVEKLYDYEKLQVYFKVSDGDGVALQEKYFPIKGLICDDVSMFYFLRALIFSKNKKLGFYLVVNEPKMYKVSVIERGTEDLFVDGQKTLAVKYQLFAGLGKLAQWISKFVAPTYIWYAQQEPNIWIQYEGMETGYGSAHITMTVNTKNH